MGERAVEEPATADEIRQIAELAGQSVKEGAVGFSTNRLPGHRLPDGRSIPGTFAHRDELRAVAKAVGAYGGFMQTVSDFREFDEEMELIADEARSSRGALFSSAAEIGIGGLATNNFFETPAWMELRQFDFDGRLKAIRDADYRQRLIAEVKEQGQPVLDGTKRWFWMGDGERPCYTQALDDSLYAMAQAADEHPVETWLRITDETNGKALFHMRGFNVNLDSLEELITTEWAMPGLGDAGAHVSQMIDSGWSTFILSHWHRDSGVYSLEEAVRRISAVPAGVLGLEDRGVLAVGKRADVNVFDISRLEERMPEIVNDFPFGAPRFIQRAAGYKATLCNGDVVLRDDELTGARPGRVLRSN